jgi:L-threonylcarbamoyladenylate synthase
MVIEHPSQEELHLAAMRLKEGQLLAFPTETVYGLGADADNALAVSQIFEAKGRPKDHPLIVHVGEMASVEHFAQDVPEFAKILMQHFWPGPLTLILHKKADVANAASGAHATIGLRMPSHPLALALLTHSKRLGIWGIAAPSANRFGRVSPTTAQHVQEEFDSQLMILDGGPCEIGIESTIVDCTRDQPIVLRPGQLSLPTLEDALGAKVHLQLIDQDEMTNADHLAPSSLPSPSPAPQVSGRLLAHYAPAAKVMLFNLNALISRLSSHQPQAHERIGIWSMHDLSQESKSYASYLYKSMPSDADACAHLLFGVLRDFDKAGATEIWIERPPSSMQWLGIHDRLKRASSAQ